MKNSPLISLCFMILLSLFFAPSCKESEFSGSSKKPGSSGGDNNPRPTGGSTPDPTSGAPTSGDSNEGDTLGSSSGSTSGAPPSNPSVIDYAQCAGFSGLGQQHGGRCADDRVVVIINDGKAGGITCCPIGKNVLSTIATERHVLRSGSCLTDEVSTGFENIANSQVYCTKVNPLLAVETAGTSRYMSRGSTSDASLNALVRSYNQGDCCACNPGTIIAGNHSSSDNKCTDRCVRIKTK